MKPETRELRPELWPDLEKLFGARGACGGCWCMYWRLEKGNKWDTVKGAANRERLQKGVRAGTIHGILAYMDGIPVGWCTFGPRVEFPRLNRAPGLKCSDAEHVWSVPCFYVKSGYRGKGVATALLEHALRAMKAKGAGMVEGYPSKPGKDGRYVAAFSWTGTLRLFRKAGFVSADSKETGKQRVRKSLQDIQALTITRGDMT